MSKSLSLALGFAGLFGVSVASVAIPSAANAQTRYEYSPVLVQRYTSGCSQKLQANGKTAEQAQSLCQCSLNQMQLQHSQGQAIQILLAAQFNPAIDPAIGMPRVLSKYFAPCVA
jgi:hypothetical protein